SAFQQDLTPFGFFGLTLRNIFIAEFVVHRVWTREASRPSFLHPRQKLSVRAGPIRLRQGAAVSCPRRTRIVSHAPSRVRPAVTDHAGGARRPVVAPWY